CRYQSGVRIVSSVHHNISRPDHRKTEPASALDRGRRAALDRTRAAERNTAALLPDSFLHALRKAAGRAGPRPAIFWNAATLARYRRHRALEREHDQRPRAADPAHTAARSVSNRRLVLRGADGV